MRVLTHTIFSLIALVLNVVLLYCFNLYRESPNWLSNIETAFWMFFAGRLFEELRQIRDDGLGHYLRAFWNKIDLMLLITQSIAFVLRCIIVSLHFRFPPDDFSPPPLPGLEPPAPPSPAAPPDKPSPPPPAPPRLVESNANDNIPMRLVQAQFDFQVFGFICFVLRSLEILNHIPEIGEVFMLLREMMYEATPVIIYMLIIAVATGICFHAGMPPIPPAGPGIPEVTAGHWAFAGFWAILGENDVVRSFYVDSSQLRNEANWYPVLFYMVSFFTTIFIVNLLIAKMTSTYERILDQSLYWRAMMRCDFCIEYKDERFAPPPLNLFIGAFNFFCGRCGFCGICSSDGEHPRGFAVSMGRNASMRIQAREQRCARDYDKQSEHDRTHSTENKVSAIFDDLDMLRALSRRCEALEKANHNMCDMLRSQGSMLEHLYAMSTEKDEVGDRGDSRGPAARFPNRVRHHRRRCNSGLPPTHNSGQLYSAELGVDASSAVGATAAIAARNQHDPASAERPPKEMGNRTERAGSNWLARQMDEESQEQSIMAAEEWLFTPPDSSNSGPKDAGIATLVGARSWVELGPSSRGLGS